MNQLTITPPPMETITQGTLPAVVGLHLGEPVLNLVFGEMLPLNNLGAAPILARVLTLALGQDLLSEDAEVLVLGTLGDGVCLVWTRDARQTIETIKAELDRLVMLPLCQIGIQTPQGWRCVHPGPEIDMAELMNINRFRVLHEQQRARLIAQKAAWLKLFKPPTGDHPPGNPPPPAAK